MMMPFAALLLAAALASDPVDRVILRSGQSIAVVGEIRQEGDKLLFRSPAGVLYSIAIAEVDFAAMARTGPKDDPVEELDRGARHPARRLTVTPEERDRLLDELSKRKSSASPVDPEVLSPIPDSGPAKPASPAAGAEERWRAEARAAREAVERRKNDLEALRRRVTELEDQLRLLLSSGYDPSLLSAQALELDRARNGIDGAQEALRDAQRALTDLQERARKAGVLPGWLRDS
jgi:hypothetical protein